MHICRYKKRKLLHLHMPRVLWIHVWLWNPLGSSTTCDLCAHCSILTSVLIVAWY